MDGRRVDSEQYQYVKRWHDNHEMWLNYAILAAIILLVAVVAYAI